MLEGTLTESLCAHAKRETVSFHMPGHKGRLNLPGMPAFTDFTSEFDVTELDGLDDLSYPAGVLKGLEERIAFLYRVKESIISVSGASGGLMAAILSVANRGTELLVPRNTHRAVVHALVLSGLKPRWYEPVWNGEWGVWENVTQDAIRAALTETGTDTAAIAGALVVSPTFPGAVSDIEALAELLHEFDIPLIVDEAQGAHFLPATSMPQSACISGADLVVHSFHKTLGALTQTGVVHVVSTRYVNADDVRASMRLISTSSPNYVLLSSIEQAVLLHETKEGLERLTAVGQLAEKLRRSVGEKSQVYSPPSGFDPLHVTVGSYALDGASLNEFLLTRGIYAEAVLGTGCLLLLGAGTENQDIDLVLSALAELPEGNENHPTNAVPKPQPVDQLISPREAFFAATELVQLSEAEGRISADCLAPCPPGMPVCIPGARVAADFTNLACAFEKYIRVLLEPGRIDDRKPSIDAT